MHGPTCIFWDNLTPFSTCGPRGAEGEGPGGNLVGVPRRPEGLWAGGVEGLGGGAGRQHSAGPPGTAGAPRPATWSCAGLSTTTSGPGVSVRLPEAHDLLFQTFRRTVVHVRAPGEGWSRLCSLKTARAVEVFTEVLEMENFEKAKTQGRSFCSTCLGG